MFLRLSQLSPMEVSRWRSQVTDAAMTVRGLVWAALLACLGPQEAHLPKRPGLCSCQDGWVCDDWLRKEASFPHVYFASVLVVRQRAALCCCVHAKKAP